MVRTDVHTQWFTPSPSLHTCPPVASARSLIRMTSESFFEGIPRTLTEIMRNCPRV